MEKRIPYYRKPDDMTVDEWQSGLRRQFAVEQKFRIKNTGGHPVFSDFEVYNPGSGNTYKVSVRDNVKSFNFCSCPDFTISALGKTSFITFRNIKSTADTLKTLTILPGPRLVFITAGSEK